PDRRKALYQPSGISRDGGREQRRQRELVLEDLVEVGGACAVVGVHRVVGRGLTYLLADGTLQDALVGGDDEDASRDPQEGPDGVEGFDHLMRRAAIDFIDEDDDALNVCFLDEISEEGLELLLRR